MQYIILTVLVFLQTTLSASHVTPEKDKRSYSTISYMGSPFLPREIKRTVLNDQNLSPNDMICFGLTNKGNFQLVSTHYPVKLILGALRYQIKNIFSNHHSFDNKEEAIASANLFLTAYFPDEKAIDTFIDMYLPSQDKQEPYKEFLEYVSSCFSNNNPQDYFVMRQQIMSRIGDSVCILHNFNTMFLPPEIANLTDLVKLYLGYNQLQVIPDISNLTNLTLLGLNNNRLKSVPAWISTLTNLLVLGLNNNRLLVLPEISTLTNLQHLISSHNQLLILPDISTLTNLRGLLNLSKNQLQEMPDISTLTNLRGLDLSDNQLLVLPEISTLTNLMLLNLSKNQLQEMPDISALTNLRKIYFSDNK